VATSSVAELCHQRSWTVEDLTTACGLDAQRVLAIVLGRWTPSPADRRAVAAALDVEVEDITWGHVTPIQHIYGQGPG
tara:strand:- start:616 stop:849 length:234 start_codon:yes stop_codon:yes gene_type:complete